MADFYFEDDIWNKGYYVIGVDEVGRGPLAGPIVAGAVIFKPSVRKNVSLHTQADVRIDDSKKLTPQQRETSFQWIKKNSLVWGVGSCSVAEINNLGIQKANFRAMRRAIYTCLGNIKKEIPLYLISDFLHIPFLKRIGSKNQTNIAKADTLSFTVAAASILAKVYRDIIMKNLSVKHPVYGWGRNMGYATAFHRTALQKYGPAKHHRKVFIKKYVIQNNSAQR